MNKRSKEQQGVTLIELLITIAILGIILAGIYGLLDAANRTYLNTRAVVENNATGRVVLNYLLYRLREIDGSGLVKDPRYCIDCHDPDLDGKMGEDNPNIPCVRDVRIPRRTLMIENISTLPLEDLDGVDPNYQHLDGANAITFWADLLPVTGINDEFTDSPSTLPGVSPHGGPFRNRVYDLVKDEDGDGEYDPDDNDFEILYFDYNDDGQYQYFAEKWSYELRKAPTHNSFLLIEKFTDRHTTPEGGNLDLSDRNASSYTPYTVPIAYGVTGLGIKIIPRIVTAPDPKDVKLRDTRCGAGSGPNIDTCHGKNASATWLNVYENETAFSYARFIETHPFWNIRAISLETATTDPSGKKFMKMKQVLVPRNIEVNQEHYVEQ